MEHIKRKLQKNDNILWHITDTTQLKCDKGTIPTPITVTSQSFMSIEGKFQATEEDKQPTATLNLLGYAVF
ncbi:hypothetical protein [Chryseobacterium luteum]|uniref:hypothetical protein n=1 Tax=Chryseobacterium luteum TaxID=421531 RepID=UPI00068B5D98|nr:hypothetical protein [Chryseobacterium luteum]